MEDSSKAGEIGSTWAESSSVSSEVVMTIKSALAVTTLIVAACAVGAACGPLRADGMPHIRGTVVNVDGRAVAIKHKTGRTYEIAVTRDTRIVDKRQPRDGRVCPGQRATVFLAAPGRFTASSITLWSGRCQ